MASSSSSQLWPSGCTKQNKHLNLCNKFVARVTKFEDKRLLVTSKIVQPTYLKFSKKYQIELIRAKNSKGKDNAFAGYNSFRGDFQIEYNDGAEYSIGLACQLDQYRQHTSDSDVKNEDQILIENLQVALFSKYTSQLQERNRRKSVIKKHGLMNTKGTGVWYSHLEATLGKSCAKKIIRFSSITSADEIEHLSSTLELMNAKRAEVNKLNFYRTQRGIKNKWDMAIFESERTKREQIVERVDIRNFGSTQTVKRKRPCIDIFHLPRYKELLPKESELCRSNGLSPSHYLDIKDCLISDCKKNNGLLLKRARKLIKIDVNKTRKIYDLLLEEGFTWAPA